MGQGEDGQRPGEVSCSFCGKGQREVHKVVVGRDACICDECIALCGDILVEEIVGERSAILQREAQLKKGAEDAQVLAALLIKACEANPRVPQVITDLAVALAVALDKHLNPPKD